MGISGIFCFNEFQVDIYDIIYIYIFFVVAILHMPYVISRLIVFIRL